MKLCRISNCKNPAHGVICSTHRYRWNTYNSYDLPSYTGLPNYLTDIPLSEGHVKRCKVHGELTIEHVYIRYHKSVPNYACKECLLNKNLKNKYKTISSIDDYNKLLAEQNGVCGMCKSEKNNTTRNGKTKRFNMDHDHKTGKDRELLCSFCNSLLGYARDSIEILQSAIEYLRKHNDQNRL